MSEAVAAWRSAPCIAGAQTSTRGKGHRTHARPAGKMTVFWHKGKSEHMARVTPSLWQMSLRVNSRTVPQIHHSTATSASGCVRAACARDVGFLSPRMSCPLACMAEDGERAAHSWAHAAPHSPSATMIITTAECSDSVSHVYNLIYTDNPI